MDTGAPEAVVLKKHHQVYTLTRHAPECVLAVSEVPLFYTLGTQRKPHRPSLRLKDMEVNGRGRR